MDSHASVQAGTDDASSIRPQGVDRNMMKIPLAIVLVACAALPVQSAYGARKSKVSVQNGEMLAQSCLGCHGSSGVSSASPMPSLGGQNEAYLENTMRAFRDGDRPGTVMPRFMKAYSDGEIKGIASYFAKFSWTPGKQVSDAALAEQGKRVYQRVCKDCHPNGGRESSEGEYPLLAGQWLPYTRATIANVRSGKHKVDSKFEAKIGEVSPQDVEAALNFFASQQ
jgi:cytochrome subunit of sulfide dehydrogenase